MKTMLAWGRLVTCGRVANPPTKFALIRLNHRNRVGQKADGRRLTTGAQIANLPYVINSWTPHKTPLI